MKDASVKQIFSSNIRACRKIKNYTQQKLADKLGATRSNVGSWEEGRALPSVEMIMKISDHFQIEMRSFLTNPLPEDFII